jgi:hypothetical protein
LKGGERGDRLIDDGQLQYKLRDDSIENGYYVGSLDTEVSTARDSDVLGNGSDEGRDIGGDACTNLLDAQCIDCMKTTYL